MRPETAKKKNFCPLTSGEDMKKREFTPTLLWRSNHHKIQQKGFCTTKSLAGTHLGQNPFHEVQE